MQSDRDVAKEQYSPLPTHPSNSHEFSQYNDAPKSPSDNSRELRVTQEDMSAFLAASKSINILGGMETAGTCSVEKSSVYGAALAMPQIARSAQWPKSLFFLTLRSFLFVFVNYVVQSFFIYYIYDSQTNMNPFGSQMHLCDFAAHISECPDGPNCLGPASSRIPSPGDLYPYDIWFTRKFMRDVLLTLFPHLRDEIHDKVDPGEYGLESYYCRFLCIFVFLISIADEFQNIRDLCWLLWNLPSREDAWLQYNKPADAPKCTDKSGKSELQYMRFFVNGMPRRWKFFNIIFLLIPKIFIWRMLTMAGVHFLMETAAMVDQIVNTTALSFVFTTDELLLDRLTTKASKYIMANLEEYELYDYTPYGDSSDEEELNRYNSREMTWWISCPRDWWLFPQRFCWAVVLTLLFLAEYYWHNCTKYETGGFVSVDMFYPLSSHLDLSVFFSKFFSAPHEEAGGKFWAQQDGGKSFWTLPQL